MVDKKTKKSYSTRTAKQFNRWRRLFQIMICKIFYYLIFKIVYKMEVRGKENIPKTNDYIVCPNHLSTLDPPLIVSIFPRGVAFMAKKELFDIKFLRWWIDWLGAFSVNRESLEPSTVKTIIGIKKSNWVLGMFPQGTRQKPGTIEEVSKGFAGLAKITKCAILPVGIIGTEKSRKIPFSGKIIVNIGEPIPYQDDLDKMVKDWANAIEKLTGYKYIPVET